MRLLTTSPHGNIQKWKSRKYCTVSTINGIRYSDISINIYQVHTYVNWKGFILLCSFHMQSTNYQHVKSSLNKLVQSNVTSDCNVLCSLSVLYLTCWSVDMSNCLRCVVVRALLQQPEAKGLFPEGAIECFRR